MGNVRRREESGFAYTLLNAPGIGKTALLDRFGKMIMDRKQGIYIKITAGYADGNFEWYVCNWIRPFEECVIKKQSYILDYIRENYPPEMTDDEIRNLNLIVERFRDEAALKKHSENNIPGFIEDLALIIPVLLVLDDVQIWQEIQSADKNETALHYTAKMVARLPKFPVLLILTGTRYTILSQIGRTISSPLRNRVIPMAITLFSKENVEEYADVISVRLREYMGEDEKDSYEMCLTAYRNFLLKFSGGHPRTIRNITNYFLSQLRNLIPAAKESPPYDEFERRFMGAVKKIHDLLKNSVKYCSLRPVFLNDGQFPDHLSIRTAGKRRKMCLKNRFFPRTRNVKKFS